MYTSARSKKFFAQAQQSIPGGVNSPVRAFKNVGGSPVFISHAKGAKLYDEDGNNYLDFICSWGPMILGHAHPKLTLALEETLRKGTSFGAPTEKETELAELVKTLAPNVELIRMVNSGTEACMSAVRLARGYTGRAKFIKFEGNYHGHADMFLLDAGSGVATLKLDRSAGVTAGVAQDTLSCPYNDTDALEKIVAAHARDLAAIIVEPVAGNMGCIPPAEHFLQTIRRLCTKHGIVFIMDEVMTGFRLSLGGAQQFFNIDADLVCYGKIIGGGLPVGAFGGRKEIMSCVAPLGSVYQAGTLSGNPLAMTAGITTLQILREQPEVYTHLTQITNALAQGLVKIFTAHKISHAVQHVGSMISVFFSDKPVRNFAEVKKSDSETFKKLFHGLLERGVYLPPSPFESWFLGAALTDADIRFTLEKVEEVLSA